MKQKSIIVAIIALLSLTATSMKGFAQNNDGLDPELAQYLTVQHFEGDFSMAQLEQDAQSGNADAQCFLGMCYMTGINTVPDFKKAFEWLEKAANQDYQLALALMGMFYYQGGEEMGGILELPIDYKKTCDYWRRLPVKTESYISHFLYTLPYCIDEPFSFFRTPYGFDEETYINQLQQEASSNNPTAQYQLAVYYSGYNAEVDSLPEEQREAVMEERAEKSMYWYRRAAEQGHAMAQLHLAHELAMEESENVHTSPQVIEWVRRAAEQDNLDAIKSLAFCLLTKENPDTAQAVALCRKAAMRGDDEAQLFTGNFYYLGKGVPQDYNEAFRWYQRASECQDILTNPSEVYSQMGACYLLGQGVEQNYDKAMEYFNKIGGGDFGSIFGHNYYLLAKYHEGLGDESKALEYHKKAAENGNWYSAAKLADYYYEGSHGFPQDYEKAADYYSVIINPDIDTTGWFAKANTIKELTPLYSMDIDSALMEMDTAIVEIFEAENLPINLEDYADCDFYIEAQRGDVEAQLKLGKMLLEGDPALDYQTDKDLAVIWLEKAARQGSVEAQYLLGECYEGIPHSRQEIYDEESGEYIIEEYEDTEFLENQRKSFEWYLKAAQNGHAQAQLKVAQHYEYENDEQAIMWYRRAAEAGLAEAQYELANHYLEDEHGAYDYSQAVAWLQKAAAQNNLDAYESLADCYLNGNGVNQDVTQAIYWLEKAAYGGRESVANTLGYMYSEGDMIPQDYNKAVYWYYIGANSLNESKNSLGECYRDGKGVARDYKKAVYWFRSAAEDGDIDAQHNLSECYRNGWGVPQSTSQADYWENMVTQAQEEFETVPATLYNDYMKAPAPKTDANGFVKVLDCPTSFPNVRVDSKKAGDSEFELTVFIDGDEMQTIYCDLISYSDEQDSRTVRFLDANFDGYIDMLIGPACPREYSALYLWDPDMGEFDRASYNNDEDNLLNGYFIFNPKTKTWYSFLAGGAMMSGYEKLTWEDDNLRAVENVLMVSDPSNYREYGVKKKYTLYKGSSENPGRKIADSNSTKSLPADWQKAIKIL